VDGVDESQLEAVLDRYLEASIAALTQRLEQTNDRATRTALETILHKSGRYAASEALLTDLAASGEALARNALAYHWAERDINLERALSYADSAVASDPGSASFQDTRSLVLYRLGRLEESLAAAERAVALDPHPIILDHYGDILWAAGRCADAARVWRGALADSEDVLLRQRVARKLVGGPEGPPVFD
jgi:tetratricopeptide (TPR) repeat protein